MNMSQNTTTAVQIDNVAFGERFKKALPKIILTVIMTLITVMILYPLLFVLTTSFKDYAEFVKNPFAISFRHPSNYVTAWVDGNFSRYFVNSVLISSVSVVRSVLFAAVASFCIGVLKFKGSKIFVLIFLSTMFFTGEMTSIPKFLLLRELGFLNSRMALLFGAILGPEGMGTILGINYVKKIPKELHEAAILDGAGIVQVFFRVDLILMTPILTFVAIQTFMGSWGDFFWPLITITTNDAAKTLPLGLITFQGQNQSQYGVLAAGLCMLTLPVILLYSFLSKYFIQGVAAGAVKG